METTIERVCMAPVTRRARQPDPRPQAVGPIKRIWLLLYSEGGWWGGAEILDRLRMTPGQRRLVYEMVVGGFLQRRLHTTPEGEEVVQYGVTRMCKVPRGVTIAEMWSILQITAQGKQG